MNIALIGNPNCGKTTLFNALTGAKQRIGNWPGVTVERKTGHYKMAGSDVSVVDLPGVYSLVATCDSAVDERIACDYMLSGEADVIVNVVDAANLERHLYLTTQLLDFGLPMVVAVNMMDVAKKRGITLDLQALEKQLGCSVVPLQASKSKGVNALKTAIANSVNSRPSTAIVYSHELEVAIARLTHIVRAGRPCSQLIPEHGRQKAHGQRLLAMHVLEDDVVARGRLAAPVLQQVALMQQSVQTACGEDCDILFADARYTFIEGVVDAVMQKTAGKKTLTERIDRVVLNRFAGIPIFFAVMYLMFFFAINVGGAFQDFFDIGSDVIFVQGASHLLSSVGLPDWFVAIIGVGVGKGINTTVTFIPILAAMFLFLAILENSGYMMRAAFVMDRCMRALGLPGKSFVPMIVGLGCNVPAIMGARTLDNHRDRVLTVLMAPFMSCGARFAIYAVFTAAFFPQHGAIVVFSLYVIGIAMAVLTGLLLRKTLLKGDSAPMIMELPRYHLPLLKSIALQTWQRLKNFIVKAGRYIVPVCVLISGLNALTMQGHLLEDHQPSNSVLAAAGRAMTPVFAPMGISQDNWPATVGLMTGVLAKEVVVGTLNTLYVDRAHLASDKPEVFDLAAGLREAWQSVPDNFADLGAALLNPVAASAATTAVTTGVLGQMYRYFDGRVGAFAYLLFVLLYIPCITAIATIARELNRAWAIFSMGWNTGIAYGMAVVFYQLGTLMRHPASSLGWIAAMSALFVVVIISLRVGSVNMRLSLPKRGEMGS